MAKAKIKARPVDLTDHKCRCGASAPFSERDMEGGGRSHFCRHHVPADWVLVNPRMGPTVPRVLEDGLIALLKKKLTTVATV
jgi:hypothetical protein